MPIDKYFHGSGRKVLANMEKEYGEKKGLKVFYATANKRKMKPKSMRSGGMTSYTGKYRLHEGEMVLPASITKRLVSMIMEHQRGGKFK
jgi:hypothetical protein